MIDDQATLPAPTARPASLPPLLHAASVASVLLGVVCAVPALYYAYLDIHPPAPLPGDLYFGDGTGFVVSAVAASPAVALLAAGILIRAMWRRGWAGAATAVAVLASLPALWIAFVATWVLA